MLIIFGDSHVKCLKSGYELLPQPMVRADGIKFAAIAPFPRFLNPFFEATPDGATFTKSSLRRAYFDATGDDRIPAGTGTTFVFSAPLNTLGLLCNEDWNNFSPPGIYDEKQPISLAVMEQVVIQHFEPITAFVKALVDLKIECVVASAPPTRFDNVHFAKKASLEALKTIDQTCRSTMTRKLEDLGIAVVHPPEGTFDENKNLLPPFHHDSKADFHHANSSYGMLMMENILKRVGG